LHGETLESVREQAEEPVYFYWDSLSISLSSFSVEDGGQQA